MQAEVKTPTTHLTLDDIRKLSEQGGRKRGRGSRDKSLTIVAYLAIVAMAGFLVWVMGPVFYKGAGAYLFKGTVEHRRVMHDWYGRGDAAKLAAEIEAVNVARKAVYDSIEEFKKSPQNRGELRDQFDDVCELVAVLFGNNDASLPRNKYGRTRWEQALEVRGEIFTDHYWDYDSDEANAKGEAIQRAQPRAPLFAGTALTPLFDALDASLEQMFKPRRTFYARFLTDGSVDSHFFGGIGPEALGTLYLALGALLFAAPVGIAAAVYFKEFAKDGTIMKVLRSCVDTLSGVPSVVFGLFGLAFFINTVGVSSGKSVVAGAMTLALLILPVIIRASEEAIAAVPVTYREASFALGAGKFKTVFSVVVPAAAPGILTGVVISLARAAGETAPIIFTAAVSLGRLVRPADLLTHPTPALPWSLYNLCSEHEAADQIRHMQFGMAATLVLIVLTLNLAAIILRARMSKKLKGA